MNLIPLLVLVISTSIACGKEDAINDISNTATESSSVPVTTNLDTNLRRALLKALSELENEENATKQSELKDKVVEKASASAVTIYAKGADFQAAGNYATTTSSNDDYESSSEELQNNSNESEEGNESLKASYVLLQKSDSVQQKTITSFEDNNSDEILTSASSTNFNPDGIKGTSASANLLDTQTKASKKNVETTTVTTTTSTEESEAKVEDVQFFSAPLVAAFTVHQDERGQPKKVEPIYKNQPKTNQLNSQQNLPVNNQATSNQFNNNQLNVPQNQPVNSPNQLSNQLLLQQKALEEEIRKLRLQQEHQELLLRQQLEKEKLLTLQLKKQQELKQQQEKLKIDEERLKQFRQSSDEEKLKLLRLQQQTDQLLRNNQDVLRHQDQQRFQQNQEPFKPIVNNNKKVLFQQSVSFDPLQEAGKLPVNGQILPIKNAIDFRTPIVQTPQFQQFHSVSAPVNNFQSSFNKFPVAQQLHNNRFLRQEANVGNFVNHNPTFSIQKSVQPVPVNSQTFYRPFDSFSGGLNGNHLAPVHGNNNFLTGNRFFRSNIEQVNNAPVQPNRFFRSNLESSHSFNNRFPDPVANSYRLNNLLYTSGAFDKQRDDLSIVSKVLSLNHLGSENNKYFAGIRRNLRVAIPGI